MITVLILVGVWMALGLLLALALGAVIRMADDNEQHCPQNSGNPAPEAEAATPRALNVKDGV